MPKNPKEAAYPLQKELFDALRADDARFVQRYLRDAKLSKTAVYNRLSGYTPISFDEGCKLLTGRAAVPDGQMAILTEVQAANRLTAYFSGSSSDSSTLLLSLRTLPGLYLAHSPILLALRLFIADWLDAKAQNRRLPVFSPAYCELPKARTFITAHEQALRHLYELPPWRQSEIWHPSLLNDLLASIQEIKAFGALEDESAWQEIRKGLSGLVDALAHRTRKHEVFLSAQTPASSQLILASNTALSHWIWIGAGSVLHTNEAQSLEPAAALLAKLRACGKAISPSQGAGQQFFGKLRGHFALL
jgi:hypothetical protein